MWSRRIALLPRHATLKCGAAHACSSRATGSSRTTNAGVSRTRRASSMHRRRPRGLRNCAWRGLARDAARDVRARGRRAATHRPLLARFAVQRHPTCDSRCGGAPADPPWRVGLNLYRDGRDSVAPHNDHLSELREGFPIALVSLGATRRMTIRAKAAPHRTTHIDLEPGSLFVMDYATQLHHTHRVPKTRERVGERISLAFRVKPDRTASDRGKRSSDFVVCEPRRASWFSSAAETLLQQFEIGRVAADPTTIPGADRPGGWPGIVYYRLHGSPRKYWSTYEHSFLQRIAEGMRRVPASTAAWCIFDNTAGGAALENAWQLSALLDDEPAKGVVGGHPGSR